jgi:hypothetical protein
VTRANGLRVLRDSVLSLSILAFTSALGFFLPWCNSVVGQVSGSQSADLVVAYGPYITEVPPPLIGWLGVGAPSLAGCALLVSVVNRAVGKTVAVIGMLIFLLFAAGARYLAVGPMSAGWWLSAGSSVVGVVSAFRRRKYKTDQVAERWLFATFGTALTMFAVVQLVESQPRRSLGATTAEQGAAGFAEATLGGDSATGFKLLDPTEFVSAREMFRNVGSKLQWLPKVRLNLTKSGRPKGRAESGLRAAVTKTNPDGSVEVKVNTNYSSLKGRARRSLLPKRWH